MKTAVASTAFVAVALALLAVFAGRSLPERTGPPVEEVAVEHVRMSPSILELTVRNTGPDPVQIAQVFVNDAYVDVTGGVDPIGTKGTAVLKLDYPWIDGQPYLVSMLTSTGLVIEHEIPLATTSPTPDRSFFGLMALLGTYVGIIPVVLGMLLFPALKRLGRNGIRFLLALTVGLLAFLAVDAVFEGFELGQESSGAFGGVSLLALGAILAFLGLTAVDGWLGKGMAAGGAGRTQQGERTGGRLALMIAIGIGLHNLGEGLAIGTAYAIGELALGTALVVGFALHNTTEGLAIVAPLLRSERLAIVVGGTSAEFALKTAKYASAHYLDTLPTAGSPTGHGFRDLELEAKVFELTQKIGIGAQFGGKYFCHDVRVVRLPRHGASCPVAIAVSCSADRQALAKITAEGVFLEQLEFDPAQYLPETTDEHLDDDVVRIDLDRPMDEIRAELSKYPVKTRLSLTGTLVVARDIAHAKIKELLDSGQPMPEYMRNHPVYYAGPAKTPEGYASGSFGPTTAGRMDSYVDEFQAAGGSFVMLAKGNRSQQVIDACAKHGGFYLGSIGGPAARLALDCIRKVEVLEYPELGMEAVWRIEVEDFPAFIVTDDKGNDFFAVPKETPTFRNIPVHSGG